MSFERTVLDNGITIVSEKMEGVRSCALGIWVRVGNRDESPKLYGMSHFMEHMVFKGTATRSAIEISMAFDGIGADLNAFTGREYTCFYSRMVDNRLPEAFELLSDIVVNPAFDDECVELEKKVVLEEIARSEDDPEDCAFDLLVASMRPDHPLGKPILGTKETVSSFTSQDLRAYHSQHYTTENIYVVASGSVNHDQLVELSQRYLEGIVPGPKLVRASVEPGQAIPFSAIKKDTEQAHILMGMPSISAGDPRRHAYNILDSILGGGMSSRLFAEIRESRGLVYTVYSSQHPNEDTGTFAVYAGTRPGNIAEVVEITKRELDKMRTGGIEPSELARVREMICGTCALQLESTRTRMFRLGKMIVGGREPKTLDQTLEAYRSVTAEQVNEAARDLLSQELTIAVVSPLDTETIKGLIG